jgi:Flavin containing amine oxidoreductase
MAAAPRVTVAGGGLAGLTAALRLAQRGYRVKLYEEKGVLGGNVGSRPSADGTQLDVYPHMYLNWYNNFWSLVREVTDVDRSELFAPHTKIKQLSRGEFPDFTELIDMYSPWHMLENLFSGVGPPADMFVFGYSSVDLLAEQLQPTVNLHGMTLNSFLHARPYMTKRAAAAYDSFITRVWAIPSKLTSASDYRRFLEYSVAEPSPDLWLARGPASRQYIDPLEKALEGEGVEIVREARVTGVSCTRKRAREIRVERTHYVEEHRKWVRTGEHWDEDVDELVLAVPPTALSRIVRAGQHGHRIVDHIPEIAGVSHLRTERIPILNLHFNRTLEQIPPEPVGLFDSRLALAFTDISQTWQDVPQFDGHTILALSSSDAYGLRGPPWQDDAMAMLEELAEYVDFDPGTKWGESDDIDWKLTNYHSNQDWKLFVNETGSHGWRPAEAAKGIANLAFAGDFCRNRIGMTVIESAVTTGLEAANVIIERRGIGKPAEIIEPTSLPGSLFAWLRYAWAPYAASASVWSKGSDCVGGVGSRLSDTQSLLRHLLTPTPARQQ